MKVRFKFDIKVDEIVEIPKENEELALKFIDEKKPLLTKENVISEVAYALNTEKENIKVENEFYEIVEE